MKIQGDERTAYENKGRRSPRHAFLFQVGDQKPVKIFTTVKPAKQKVQIRLTEPHIMRALKLDGRGDAQNCAGAVCVKDDAGAFPHPFSGHVDWFHHRVYIADANNSIGLPKSCVAYRAVGMARRVATLFDSKAGLKKLLQMVRRDGAITVTLEPPVYVTREKNRPKGKPGAPTRRKIGAQGHKLRLTKIGSGAAWFKAIAKAAA